MDNSNVKDKAFFVWYVIGIVFLVITILWILLHFKETVAMLVMSVLLSYFLLPVVTFLSNPISISLKNYLEIGKLKIKLFNKPFHFATKKGVSRTLAITVAFGLMGLVLAMFIFYVVPLTTSEIQNFYSNRATYKYQLVKLYGNYTSFIASHVPVTIKPYLLPDLSQKIDVSEIYKMTVQAIGSSVPAVKNLMSSIAHYIWIPFVTFYILMDYNIYKEAVFAVIPKKKRSEIKELFSEINHMLRQYIKGQMLVCLIIGSSITIAMLLMGIPYAILIGILAGVLDVIPYVGVVVTMIPAVLLALLMKGPLYALFVLVVLYLIHWIEGHVIIPNIMGNSINLPPLVVIVALIIGAETMGVLGMLLAVPVAATLRVVIAFYVRKNRLAEEQEPA